MFNTWVTIIDLNAMIGSKNAFVSPIMHQFKCMYLDVITDGADAQCGHWTQLYMSSYNPQIREHHACHSLQCTSKRLTPDKCRIWHHTIWERLDRETLMNSDFTFIGQCSNKFVAFHEHVGFCKSSTSSIKFNSTFDLEIEIKIKTNGFHVSTSVIAHLEFSQKAYLSK